MDTALRRTALLLVAIAPVLVGRPSSAVASVLCKNLHGGLLVRDACRRREETLTPPRIDELGLRGPAGQAGPPGPQGGGLHVVDASGGEVGIVTSLHSAYYGTQYATVVRRMQLPDGAAPEFVLFSVTPSGLATSEYACASYYGTYHRDPDCSGPELVRCEYGGCSSAAGAFLYLPLTPKLDGTACYVRGGAEFERGDFYREFRIEAASSAQVAQECADSGGTVTTPVAACDGSYFCAQCCAIQHAVGVAPRRAVDLTTVGTPPFRLAR